MNINFKMFQKCIIIFLLFIVKFFADSQRTIENEYSGGRIKINNLSMKCMTTSGQIGRCQSIDSCILSDLQQNYLKIFEYMCVLDKSSFGICCPDNVLLNRGPHFGAEESQNSMQNDDLIENRGCGMTTRSYPKVEEERQAKVGEWPWMAAILRRGFPNVFCGGTLITDRHILTAAHCISGHNTELIVRLGEYDFYAQNETRSRDFRVLEAKPHVDFDPITYENDIAIIRLDRETIFTSYIWPICMPPSQETWADSMGIVIGWGTKFFGGPYSNVLLEVSIPIWTQDNCQNSYIHYLPNTVFCAGSKEGNRDTCQGDSGGPLLVQLPNQRWVIVGVVSWGLRCGEGNHPGIYTKVDKYISWIAENSKL